MYRTLSRSERLDASDSSVLVNDACRQLLRLPEKEWAQALDALVEQNDPIDVVDGLKAVFINPAMFGRLARQLIHAKSLAVPSQRTTRTVAVIYSRYCEGGVERVISRQIPLLLDLGFRVILMTSEFHPEREYALPDQVERVVLPSAENAFRTQGLATALREKNVDCVLYHQSSFRNCLWDLMLMRLVGVHVVALLHELPFALFGVDPHPSQCAFESARPAIYRLASRLAVLDRTQEAYFKSLGVNATFVPNPPTYDLSYCHIAPGASERTGVYWIGRLDEGVKNFTAALEIFKCLIQKEPTLQCFLVGPEYDKGAGQRVLSFIRENQLQDNVHWLGASNDVRQYLRTARVLLLTSRFETFPMLLIEAKCCGAPVVMYELPYLELTQSGRGFAAVPQDRKDLAVAEVLDILINDKKCDQMIADSLQDIHDFYSQYNLKAIWKRIIDEPAASEGSEVLIERLIVQFEQQERFLGLGVQRIFGMTGDLEVSINLLRRKIKKVYSMNALTYLVMSWIAWKRDKRQHYRIKLWRLLTSL